MTDSYSIPHDIDASIPSPARMYDYYLGGKDNFPADREAADQAYAAVCIICGFYLASTSFSAMKRGCPAAVWAGGGPVLQPTAGRPITIELTQGRVVVRIGDTVVADSRGALTLQESTYPAVQYIPMADVDQSVLRPTGTST